MLFLGNSLFAGIGGSRGSSSNNIGREKGSAASAVSSSPPSTALSSSELLSMIKKGIVHGESLTVNIVSYWLV